VEQKSLNINIDGNNKGEKQLSKLEVEALIEQKIEPYKKAINPDSAPYLTVEHFLYAIGILLTVTSSILGYMYKRMNDSSQRLHNRVDKTQTEIEEREDKIRAEFNHKCDRMDDRIWELGKFTDVKDKVDKNKNK
jgi:hypothetical protein